MISAVEYLNCKFVQSICNGILVKLILYEVDIILEILEFWFVTIRFHSYRFRSQP